MDEDDKSLIADSSFDPALKFSVVPREPGVVSRISDISRFPGEPSLLKGLCPSCLDSGFVHEARGGEVGVISDRFTGALIRCTCAKGQKIRDEDQKRGR